MILGNSVLQATSFKLPCSIRNICNISGRVVSADTNSSRRREFVYPIQHGRECCILLKNLVNVVML